MSKSNLSRMSEKGRRRRRRCEKGEKNVKVIGTLSVDEHCIKCKSSDCPKKVYSDIDMVDLMATVNTLEKIDSADVVVPENVLRAAFDNTRHRLDKGLSRAEEEEEEEIDSDLHLTEIPKEDFLDFLKNLLEDDDDR